MRLSRFVAGEAAPEGAGEGEVGSGLKVRDLIQRALRARFKILLCSEAARRLCKDFLSTERSTRPKGARRERCDAGEDAQTAEIIRSL